MLSGCMATGNDVEIRLKNLGSFSQNEPNLRGVLRLFEGIIHGLVDFFGGGFGRALGLMLLNSNRRDACSTRSARGRIVAANVHLLLGGRGGSVGIHNNMLGDPIIRGES